MYISGLTSGGYCRSHVAKCRSVPVEREQTGFDSLILGVKERHYFYVHVLVLIIRVKRSFYYVLYNHCQFVAVRIKEFYPLICIVSRSISDQQILMYVGWTMKTGVRQCLFRINKLIQNKNKIKKSIMVQSLANSNNGRDTFHEAYSII